MTYQIERGVAIDAVLKACSLCQAVRTTFHGKEMFEKRDRSPVTVADFGAQAVVSHEIVRSFSDDPLVAEEDAAALRQEENAHIKGSVISHVKQVIPELDGNEVLGSIDRGAWDPVAAGRFWTLDPIDGTKGFLRGEQYAVALALVQEGQVVLGVLGCPNLPFKMDDPEGGRGCLFVAVQGEGAVMQALQDGEGMRLDLAGRGDLSEARFCESFESSHSSHDQSARIGHVLGFQRPPLRIDSQCKYGIVARGDAAVYLRLPTTEHYLENIWDHAAGAIIVEEAGGKVTDMEGTALDFSAGKRLSNNRGIVVTNSGLHDRVLAAVREVCG